MLLPVLIKQFYFFQRIELMYSIQCQRIKLFPGQSRPINA